MPWQHLDSYFSTVDSEFVVNLFQHSAYPWSPLKSLSTHIERFFDTLSDGGSVQADRIVLRDQNNGFIEGAFTIQRTEILQSSFIDTELKIYIGAGTLLEAGATIKNHTIIEDRCEIRQGAYLRGYAFVGSRSVIGHTTEVKNSIFIRHVEAGHFAYIGDSIIGSFVNLGAGTKVSNLEFRSLSAKQAERFPEIKFRVGTETISTGLSKFGAIVGDGCETGCNSVLCPFVLLEPKCWILPNHCVLKGVYKKGSILRGK